MERFDLVKVLRSTLRSGWKTSELWIALLSLASPVIYGMIERWLVTLPENSMLAIIAGALYVAARSIVKALTARKAIDAAPIAGGHAAAHELAPYIPGAPELDPHAPPRPPLESAEHYRNLPPGPGFSPGI